MVNPITGEDVRRQDKWLTDKNRTGEMAVKVPPSLDAHHLWISHRTPRREMQFLAAVVPFRAGEAGPEIARVSDTAVRVTFRGKERTVSFAADGAADIGVDVEAIGVGF